MFQIEPRHLKIVKEILHHVSLEVFVFGSRVKGSARELSDLDLLLKGEVDPQILSRLKEAFESSNLPYKVDIICWNKISSSFQNHIKNDLVLLK